MFVEYKWVKWASELFNINPESRSKRSQVLDYKSDRVQQFKVLTFERNGTNKRNKQPTCVCMNGVTL